MISNSPDSTVILYTHTAVMTIQTMGNSPKAAPLSVELIANETGIFHTATATINAPMRPAAAATWPLAFLTASM